MVRELVITDCILVEFYRYVEEWESFIVKIVKVLYGFEWDWF